MATGFLFEMMYNDVLIHRYLLTLSWRRRFMAFFFDSYRIKKNEYDNWYFAQNMLG